MSFEELSVISAPGFELAYRGVPWDSDIFGFAVGQIDRITIAPDVDAYTGWQRFLEWLTAHNVRLVSCRIDSLALRESIALENFGFRFVEMVYHPSVDLDTVTVVNESEGVRLSVAQPEDFAAIEQIAASAFSTGRFLIDWRLDPQLSHRRYRYWVTSSLANSNHTVLAAHLGDELVAFFVTEARPNQVCYWHLTAVSPKFQGRGIGSRVWRAVISRNKAEGFERIDTTVSAHNPPVLNLYARLGFKFNRPRATFHWVR